MTHRSTGGAPERMAASAANRLRRASFGSFGTNDRRTAFSIQVDIRVPHRPVDTNTQERFE